MMYLKGRIEHFSIWLVVCYNLLNYNHNFLRKRLARLATFKIKDLMDVWGYKPFMNYGMVTELTLVILTCVVVIFKSLNSIYEQLDQMQAHLVDLDHEAYI